MPWLVKVRKCSYIVDLIQADKLTDTFDWDTIHSHMATVWTVQQLRQSLWYRDNDAGFLCQRIVRVKVQLDLSLLFRL